MSEPSVSICLPVYNGGQYLADSIESVLAQSYADFELLISDDGSMDGSAEICQEYADRDPRVRYWRNPEKRGLFGNYNECLRRARGKFIKPFAQDDLLHPDMLAQAVAVLGANQGISLLAVGRRWIDENGDDVSERVVSPRADEFVPPDCPVPGQIVIRRSISPVHNFIGEPVAVMFRAAHIGSGFDERLRHIGDWEYWLRLLTVGSFYFVGETLCSFRVHSGSQTFVNWLELHAATDFIKFVRSSGWILDDAGVGRDHFIEAALDSTAYGVSSAWQYRFSSGAASTRAIPASATISEQALWESVHDLREVSLYALRMLGERTTVKEPVPNHWPEIERLEQRVTRLLSSRSWIYTKPLRDINKRWSNGAQPLADSAGLADDDGLTQVDRQRSYIRYLRKLIAAVLSSRSWRITAPIRALMP